MIKQADSRKGEDLVSRVATLYYFKFPVINNNKNRDMQINNKCGPYVGKKINKQTWLLRMPGHWNIKQRISLKREKLPIDTHTHTHIKCTHSEFEKYDSSSKIFTRGTRADLNW